VNNHNFGGLLNLKWWGALLPAVWHEIAGCRYKIHFPSKCPSGRPVISIKSTGITSAFVWPFAFLIILQLIMPSRCFCAGIGNSHFRSFAMTTTFPERTFTLEPICRISIEKPLTPSKNPAWFCHIHLLKKWPYITSPESWNDMTTSCVSGCTLFGIRFNMEMLAASAPSPMLGILSETFVPWRNIMPAPVISSKLEYGSGGGEKSPLILNVATAEMEVIGRFNGSFLASSILICLISNPSLAANVPATIVSMAIPTINIFQPRPVDFLDALKSAMSWNISLADFFSFHSPQNTRPPPSMAKNIVTNSTTSHDSASDEKTAENIYVLIWTICGLAYLALVIFVMTRRK